MIEKSLRLIGPRATSPRTAPRAHPADTSTRQAPAGASAGRGLVLLFAATLFSSALLLFLVQPMIGKMTLPMLGGAPAAWNTCMVFFQALLLCGYAYAHASTRRLTTGRHVGLHVLLMLAPLAVLPIAAEAGSNPPSAGSPALWLLGRLTLWVGLPFFVVSTTAPLLQRWFSRTGHPTAGDPYFLYGASNLGSLAALVGYPTLVEPWTDVPVQSTLWTVGYALLVTLTACCGLAAWRAGRKATGNRQRATEGEATRQQGNEAAREERGDLSWESESQISDFKSQISDFESQIPADRSVTLRRRAYWVFAAFVPSSLMLGATTHITTDLAPMPLLWVVPLAMYMLTFVLVFARRPVIPHELICRLLPLAIVPAGLLTVGDPPLPGAALIPLHLLAFFVAAMACHGALAADRPPADRLTEFYLWMSVGGVLGGLLNALAAPLIFNREFGPWMWLTDRAPGVMDGLISPIFFDKFFEYPLAMILSWLVVRWHRRLGGARGGRAGGGTIAVAARSLILPLAILGVTYATYLFDVHAGGPRIALSLMLPGILCLMLVRRPRAFAVALALVLGCVALHTSAHEGRLIYAGRNFFGGKRVLVNEQGFHLFYHGQTSHGFQNTDPTHRREPLAYYHRSGPAGDIFAVLEARGPRRRVAVVGLGVGAMAAYARPGDVFTFYEIDPQVQRVAADPALFTFLDDCAGDCEVVLGDGRLRIAERSDATCDLIVLDAFSSDAIPTHLLTREALALYRTKLAPGGMLAFHISNNYLDLAPLLAGLADDAGLVALRRRDVQIPQEDLAAGRSPCEYVVLVRDRAESAGLPATWEELRPGPAAPVWTDHFSNILSVLRW